jgi:hypothetical protein
MVLFAIALAACGGAKSDVAEDKAAPAPRPILHVGDVDVNGFLAGPGTKLVSYLRVTDDLTSGVVSPASCDAGLVRLDAVGLSPNELDRLASTVPDPPLAARLQVDIGAVIDLLGDCVMAPADADGADAARARRDVASRLDVLRVELD